MSVTPNYYRSGGQWREPNIQPIINEIIAQKHWRQITEWDSVVGSAPAVVARTKFLTDTGSTYKDINLRDLWIDLGDGIRHKIVCVHNDLKLEFEDYIDNVPGVVSISFWQPIRVTLKLEGQNYTNGIHFENGEEGMCLSIVGDGGARLSNTPLDVIASETEPSSIAISNGLAGSSGTFLDGSLTFDDIEIDNRNHGVSVYEPVLTKAYDDSGSPIFGRLHTYFFDMKLESTYKHTGVSIWHGGTQIQMCSRFITAEQTIEHISAERGLVMDCVCDSVKSFDGHYACGVLASVRWENSVTDTYMGGMVVMGTYMGSVNCQNDTWETAAGMGNIGFLFASSEIDAARTDPTVEVKSISNLFRMEMADNTQFGQALRVSNYNAAGNTNMKISSYHDSFIALGDTTNYDDAYGDRGNIDLYYPYKTPVIGTANGGTVSTVKT